MHQLSDYKIGRLLACSKKKEKKYADIFQIPNTVDVLSSVGPTNSVAQNKVHLPTPLIKLRFFFKYV